MARPTLRRHLLILISHSCVAVCIGSMAGAQETREKPKYEGIRLGPFYLSVVAPFGAGVDNNVYNTPEGISDQSASVTPTLQVVLPLGRRARLRANGGIVPQYFHRESTQRYTDLFGDVRGEVDVGPLSPFAGLGAGRYRQRFTIEIDERIQRHQTSDVFGATLHLGRRITVTGSQTRVTSTFDDEATVDGNDVSDTLDRTTVTRRVDGGVPLTRKTSLVPFADFIQDRFLNEQPGLPPTVDSQRYGLGFAFSELAFFNGTIAGGVRRFGAGEGVLPYTGPFLSANLSSPFVLKSRLFLTAGRDVNYSVLESAAASGLRNTYVSSYYRAEVAFELPLSLKLRLGGGFLESKYLLPAAGDPFGPPRRDHGWVEGGEFLRHFGKHLSLGVQARHESRTSTVPEHSYEGMAYGLAGELRF